MKESMSLETLWAGGFEGLIFLLSVPCFFLILVGLFL